MLRAIQHTVASAVSWLLTEFRVVRADPTNFESDGGWFYHTGYNEIWQTSWVDGWTRVGFERYNPTTNQFLGTVTAGDGISNEVWSTENVVYDSVNNIIYIADSSDWSLRRYSGVNGSFISKSVTELPYLPSIDPYDNTVWSGSANSYSRVIRHNINGQYIQHWNLTASVGTFYYGGITFSPTHVYIACYNYGALLSIDKTSGVVTELRPPQTVGNRYNTISYDESRHVLWCTVYGNNSQIRKFDLTTNTETNIYTLPFAAYPSESGGANIHERVYDPVHDVLIVSSFYYSATETGELAILSAADPSQVIFHEYVSGYTPYSAPTHYMHGDCIYFTDIMRKYRKVCLAGGPHVPTISDLPLGTGHWSEFMVFDPVRYTVLINDYVDTNAAYFDIITLNLATKTQSSTRYYPFVDGWNGLPNTSAMIDFPRATISPSSLYFNEEGGFTRAIDLTTGISSRFAYIGYYHLSYDHHRNLLYAGDNTNFSNVNVINAATNLVVNTWNYSADKIVYIDSYSSFAYANDVVLHCNNYGLTNDQRIVKFDPATGTATTYWTAPATQHILTSVLFEYDHMRDCVWFIARDTSTNNFILYNIRVLASTAGTVTSKVISNNVSSSHIRSAAIDHHRNGLWFTTSDALPAGGIRMIDLDSGSVVHGPYNEKPNEYYHRDVIVTPHEVYWFDSSYANIRRLQFDA